MDEREFENELEEEQMIQRDGQLQGEGAARSDEEAEPQASSGQSSLPRREKARIGDRFADAVDDQYDKNTGIVTAVAEVVHEKAPQIFRVFGVITIILAIAVIPAIVLVTVLFVGFIQAPAESKPFFSTANIVLFAVLIVLLLALAIMLLVLGIRLVKRKDRAAALQARIMVAILSVILVVAIMLFGVDIVSQEALVLFVCLVIVATLVDPTLAEERALNRLLLRQETRADKEDGVLGRDKTGKGYIKLDFFNMFWIFVLGCVVGLVFETIICIPLNGRLENRTGMLWGPFSPIYGFGALLMTIALNRFYNKNPLIVFLVSALIGAGFEFFVSWFMQMAFGIVAWDYSGEFMNLQGRTDLLHAIVWGALGLIWVRYGLPRILELINRIPWKWRYSITTVCAVLMIFDGVVTLVAFDRWYERLNGEEPVSAVERVIDERYPNDWMADRFQSISIDPDNALRVSEGTAGMLDH